MLKSPALPANATRVRARVQDWVKRLNLLYSAVETWAKGDPRLPKGERGEILQRSEELLDRLGVLRRNLPTLTFLSGKNRIAFTPSALWIVGADGRVNLTINDQSYSLIDTRVGDDQPSDWQLVSANARQNLVSFDRFRFLELVDRSL